MGQESTLIDEIESANRDLQALLGAISEESALRPGLLGEWNARDLAAHLIGWQEAAIGTLRAIRDGAPVPSYEEDEDRFNAATLARYDVCSWKHILTTLATTQHDLVALARALPDVAWEDRRISGWLRGSTINHYPIHRADFERVAGRD